MNLCTCIEEAMQHIQALHFPPIINSDGTIKQTYTIDILDNELSIIVMVKSLLHEEYGSFILSMLMLNSLIKEAIFEMFRTEQMQQQAAKNKAKAVAAMTKHIKYKTV